LRPSVKRPSRNLTRLLSLEGKSSDLGLGVEIKSLDFGLGLQVKSLGPDLGLEDRHSDSWS